MAKASANFTVTLAWVPEIVDIWTCATCGVRIVQELSDDPYKATDSDLIGAHLYDAHLSTAQILDPTKTSGSWVRMILQPYETKPQVTLDPAFPKGL